MLPPEGGADGDTTPRRRYLHRVAVSQALAEPQPHLLVVQARQLCARQCTKASLAGPAEVTLHPPRLAIGHRSGRPAVGAAPVIADAQFERRQRGFPGRTTRQDRLGFRLLHLAQAVHRRQPRLKFFPLHHPNPSAVPTFYTKSIRTANRAKEIVL